MVDSEKERIRDDDKGNTLNLFNETAKSDDEKQQLKYGDKQNTLDLFIEPISSSENHIDDDTHERLKPEDKVNTLNLFDICFEATNDETTACSPLVEPEILNKPTIVTASFARNEDKIEEEKDENEKLTAESFEIESSRRGVLHQLMLTGGIFFLAAACGMPIGYSAVILPQLTNSSDPLSFDIEMGSWFASIHSIANPLGSFLSGPLMDKIGRRPTLIIMSVPLIFGWVLLASAKSHFILLAGRVIAGFSVGILGAPAQILISECADPKLRGFLSGLPYVSYSIGILIVYALGAILPWREVAWYATILPAIAIFVIYFNPESPTWLAAKNRNERAYKSLLWLRGDEDLASIELKAIKRRLELKAEARPPNESIFVELLKPSTLKPLILINFVNLFGVLSGTYLVVFYAVDIINSFGLSLNSTTAAIITAVVRLVFTFLYCTSLFYIRRRRLVYWTSFMSGVAALMMAIFIVMHAKSPAWYDIYICCIILFFYVSANTYFMIVPGIMIGELLPSSVRGRIAGYLLTFFGIIVFISSKCFPAWMDSIQVYGMFILFSIASFCAAIVCYYMLPETKDKALQDIEDYYQQRNWFWKTRKRFRTHDILP